MIDRIVRSAIEKTKKSILLLGPRQTGKSTLIKSLSIDLTINFADQETFLNHTQDFGLLRNQIERKNAKRIFIDEVQRIPELLNTVQSIIDDNPSIKFYLTGSSARKLKKGGANLLPGRVINFNLGPTAAATPDWPCPGRRCREPSRAGLAHSRRCRRSSSNRRYPGHRRVPRLRPTGCRRTCCR